MNLEKIIQEQNNKIQTLTAELNTYQKRCEQYAQAYDFLQHQLKELQRYRFGKKSERFIDPENPQMSLFDDNAKIFAAAETRGESINDDIQVAAHARKKQKNQKKNYLFVWKLFQ